MKTCFFDLETKKLFYEVGGRYPASNTEKLGLAVAGVIIDNNLNFFTENDVGKLFEILESADLIVGHNILEFDYRVLNPHVNYNVQLKFKHKTMDIMLHIKNVVKRKLPLDSLARHTLGVGKTHNPMNIPIMWRNGKHREVRTYLKNDLEILKKLYLYGKKHGFVKCDINGKIRKIKVRW